MTVAIYARKSTEERGAAETKSVTRQVADARAFAARRGFPPVDDRHVYADDAVSGADVKNLKNRAKLIADVAADRIDVVIMADMSRFSRREGHEVVAELKLIARRAAVWFYESGNQYVFGDIGTNIANYAVAESNADYRRKVRTKTLAAMKHKAARGYVMGGKTFGYRNVDKLSGATDASGRPIREGVTREIDPVQASVVVEIFERYAGGDGFKRIAHALNTKNAPKPRPRAGRTPGWDASSVRAVLLNPLYRGIQRWNVRKQHDEDGNQMFAINPDSDHIVCVNEAWRIVSEELAEAVDARFATSKERGLGARIARPGSAAKYLLSGGLLRCPTCGGSYEVYSRSYYVCATYRRKGSSVCNNDLAARVDVLDESVLDLLEGKVTDPEFIGHVVSLSCDNRSDDGREELEAERTGLTARITNLQMAIEAGGDIPSLVVALKERTSRLQQVESRLAAIAEPPDRATLRAALEQRGADWKQKLRGFPEEAKFVVQQLLGTMELHGSQMGDDFRVAWIARLRPEGLVTYHGVGLYGRTGQYNKLVAGGCNQLDVWKVGRALPPGSVRRARVSAPTAPRDWRSKATA